MDQQPHNLHENNYKMVFSQISCKIKLKMNDSETKLAIVIRNNRISSRSTEFRNPTSDIIQFDSTLQLPYENHSQENEQLAKEKCEILLYRYQNRKQLLGLASITINKKLFDSMQKRIRLTNSIDKEAYIRFKAALQLGEADISSQTESRVNSLYAFSETQSRKNIDSLQSLNFLPNSHHQHHEAQYTARSNKPKEKNVFLQFIHKDNQEAKKSRYTASQLNSPMRNFKSAFSTPQDEGSVDLLLNLQNQIQILNKNLQLYQTQPQKTTDSGINEQDKQQMKLIYQEMKQQNILLMQKLQDLETEMFKKKKQDSQFISNSPSFEASPNPSKLKKSPLIRKNIPADRTSPRMKLHQKCSMSTELLESEIEKSQSDSKIPQVLHQSKSHYQVKIPPKMESIKECQYQNSPLSPHKKEKSSKNLTQAFSDKFGQINNGEFLKYTFGSQKCSGKRKFKIQNPIKVTYKPPPINNWGHEKSISGTSNDQQNFSRSYTRYKSIERFRPKKYKQIGFVKNQDSKIQMSYVSNGDREQNLTQVKDHPFSLKEQLNKEQNKFYKENNKNSQNYVVNLPFTGSESQKEFWQKERVTLEQLDQRTQIRFRKNQRFLKKANEKLLKENLSLKQQKLQLQAELSTKKGLSQEELNQLHQLNAQLLSQKFSLKNQQTDKNKIIQDLQTQLIKKNSQFEELRKKYNEQRRTINKYKMLLYEKDQQEKQAQTFLAQESQSQQKASSKAGSKTMIRKKDFNSDKHSQKSTYSYRKVDSLGDEVIKNQITSARGSKKICEQSKLSDVRSVEGERSLNNINLFKRARPPVQHSKSSTSQTSQIKSQKSKNIFQFLASGFSGTGETILKK